MAKGARQLPEVSFIKLIIPTHEGTALMTQLPPKGPPPHNITLRTRFQHMNLGGEGHKHSVYRTWSFWGCSVTRHTSSTCLLAKPSDVPSILPVLYAWIPLISVLAEAFFLDRACEPDFSLNFSQVYALYSLRRVIECYVSLDSPQSAQKGMILYLNKVKQSYFAHCYVLFSLQGLRSHGAN